MEETRSGEESERPRPRFLCPNGDLQSVMGPAEMVKRLVTDKDFAIFIKDLLVRIENEDITDDGSIRDATDARRCLDSYYKTKGKENELIDIGLSKDNRDALLRCTDKNFLIAAAANYGTTLP